MALATSSGNLPIDSTSWLVRRALLAITLMAGFYVLALTVAFGLLWIPYAEWTYAGQVHFRILAACVGGSLLVLSTETIKSRSIQMLSDAESSDRTDPFDTHPSLRDRIAALGDPPVADTNHARGSAIEILRDFDAHAPALARHLVGGDDAATRLTPISWDRVGEDVIGANWRATARSNSKWLSKLTADAIPVGSSAYMKWGSEVSLRDDADMNEEQRAAYAAYVVMAGVATVLMERGWRVDASFATPASLTRDSERFEMSTFHSVVNGTSPINEWKSRCAELGIAGQPLGSA